MVKPILDPEIPYIGPVQTKLSSGKAITIRGLVPLNAGKFNINLQCGPQVNPPDDISLQISIHIEDGYISLNSMQNNVWYEEQRSHKLLLQPGERFQITIICVAKVYEIKINNENYKYSRRVGNDQITHLAIDGDVTITEISYDFDSPNPDSEGTSSKSSATSSTSPPPPYEIATSGSSTYPAPAATDTVIVNMNRHPRTSFRTTPTSAQESLVNFKLMQEADETKSLTSYWWLILVAICAVVIIIAVGVLSIAQRF